MFMNFRESDICGQFLVNFQNNIEHDIVGLCEQEYEH